MGSGLYHVCGDGTTYPDRAEKTMRELREEYNRQDRIQLGYREMERPLLGTGSKTIEEKSEIDWTSYDLFILHGYNIKP